MRHAFRVAAAVAAITLVACGSSSRASSSYQGKSLRFGGIFSLSGLGGVYGPQSKNAVLLAQDVINRSGGVNGASIAFDVQDDGSDKSQAAQQTQKLIQEGQVLALLGPTLSNSAVAAHPIADNLRTPMVATSNTGLNLVGRSCPYPCTFIFRDSLGEETAIPAAIRTYADQAHPKTGVLIYPNDDKFSADGAQIVKSNATSSGLQLLDSIEFTKNEADLSTYVTRAVQRHPDVIVITSLGGIPAKIMRAARQQGFTGQFLGGNGFNTAAVVSQAGDAGNGARSASAWYIGLDTAANRDFVKAYRDRYTTDPDQLAAQAYTGVLILADAARRAGLSFNDLAGDRRKLREALETTSLNDTPLGAFQFTRDHDVKQTIYIVAMDGKSGFNLVSTIRP